ncbi:MAG: tetratricopeptide repeat protein [Candidatus Desulforudis sp.]|nr:tetratricopeptide repeat protein [Desulforudis sp.]
MSKDTAGELDQKGQLLLREGKFDEAVKVFQEACRG